MYPSCLQASADNGGAAAGEPRIDAAREGETETRSEASVWEQRLADIPAGQEQFQKYESFCTDILQYVLGDYLSLWEAQGRTDDGLHRFDLCCKIKSGVNQDFFDTVRQYFNTKRLAFPGRINAGLAGCCRSGWRSDRDLFQYNGKRWRRGLDVPDRIIQQFNTKYIVFNTKVNLIL